MALRYISQDPYGYSDHPKVRILSFNKQIFFFSVTRLARKVSGWQSLRSLAASGGASLNLDFVSRLVQTQGVRLESLPRSTRPTHRLSSGTSHWKALYSTTPSECIVGHCPMGSVLGELLGLEQL